MKKSGIWILISVTLVFAAFVAGFYVGRNANHVPIQVQTLPQTSPTTSLPDTPPVPSKPAGKVNLNTASLEELMTLEGIGPVLAQRIIDYRIANGAFSKIEDLMQVEDIGQKRFDDIKDHITV